MKRRDFLQRSGLAMAASMTSPLLQRTGLAGTIPQVPAEKMKRIGCTTVCFRLRFPQTRPKNQSPTEPDLSLLEVPALFAEKLGVHNVELWSRHFAEHTPAYCAKMRRAVEKAGSTVCNIQMDEPGYNLSHPDKAERLKSVQFCKEWMDRAAACGATSMRANTGGDRKGPPFDVAVTGDSFAQLAEHGEKIGVKILIENHGGHSSVPENVAAIVKTVDSPWCRTLPDLGNIPRDFSQEQREAFLAKIFPWAHLVSAKGMVFDEQYKHVTYDIGRCVKLGESMGFKGIYSAEQWAPGYVPPDPFKAVQTIIGDVAAVL